MGIGRVKETGLGRKKETGALLGGQGQQFSHTSNEFAWIKKTITKGHTTRIQTKKKSKQKIIKQNVQRLMGNKQTNKIKQNVLSKLGGYFLNQREPTKYYILKSKYKYYKII